MIKYLASNQHERSKRMKYDIDNLLKVKEEVEYIDKTCELPFHEKFKIKWNAEQPLRGWCHDVFKDACEKTVGYTYEQVHKFVYEGDHKLASLYGQKLSSQELSKKQMEIQTLFEDEQHVVRAILDYDCDTTMCKFTVTHKPSGLRHRSAIDLGKKYLSMAAITIQL